MALLDKILGKAIDQLKSGFDSSNPAGSSATNAFPVNPALERAQTNLINVQTKVSYQAAIILVNLNDTLDGINLDNIATFGVNTLAERDDIKTAIQPFLDLWGVLVTSTDETNRMGTHVGDVQKNLPAIVKKSGTVKALRNSTTVVSATVPTTSSECGGDGKLIAAITETTAPCTTSPTIEAVGTATSTGTQTQQSVFACSDDLIANIDAFFATDVKAQAGSTLNYTIEPLFKLPVLWVDDHIALFAGLEATMIASSWYAPAVAIAANCTTQVTELSNTITKERVKVGLPDTDGSALALTDVNDPEYDKLKDITVPAGGADIVQPAEGAFVEEIKKNSFGVQAAILASDPCIAEISSTSGTPEMAASAATINTTITPPTPIIDVSPEPPVNEVLNKKAELSQKLKLVTWTSPSFETYFSQTKPTTSPLTLILTFDVPSQPTQRPGASTGSFDVIYNIPQDYIYDAVPTGYFISVNEKYANPASANGQALYTNFVSDIKNSQNSMLQTNNIIVLVSTNPQTGIKTIQIIGAQDLIFSCTQAAEINGNDASETEVYLQYVDINGSSSNSPARGNGTDTTYYGLFERNAVDYLEGYLNTLDTMEDLNYFETEVLDPLIP